ncbi:MAG: peptidoglycan DD-metalloendopeptidase family protein [Azonexus sp.]|jgi:lipoprotein NlpD|uniref:peptidoglycan DD-metalloendopeptidase family protein n=1 Tax=Azonexus sp. TaxID=1872668 RepID=UPI002837A6B4|nr:peptidoglycan DD-metalloendopeptidase family protein [Azonexus sp.]MDR0775019.1 peptidoglycan DD-metalloendopeptidase family protein [Azonexus sp.]
MTRVLLFALSVLSVALAGCFSQQPAPAVDRSLTAQAKPQPSGPGYYTVKRGDTLYRIAMEHGQDYRDIAAWNNLSDPAAINEGQILRVLPPVAATADSNGAVVASPIGGGGGVEARSLDAPAAAASAGGLKQEPRVGKEPYSDEAYARLNRPADTSPRPAEQPRVETKPEPATPPAPATGPDSVPWIWPTAGNVIAPFSEASNKGLDFAGKAGDPVIAAGEGKVVYAGSGLRGYGELVIIKHNATFLSAYAHNRKILVKEGQQVARGQKIAEMGNTDADRVKLHFEIRKQGKPVDPAQYLPKR